MSKNSTGSENTGNYNSGYRNSGDYNSGDYNSGYRNSGDYNSGYYNSGYYNSGYRNSGDYNSGDYNSGYRNSGWFNTNEPKLRMFNKESEYTLSELREKVGYYDLDLPVCVWKYSDDMTDEEKKSVTGWSEMGGYLKTLTYKEAWAEAWKTASEEQKNWYKNLPNFDEKIFEEITGIKINDDSLKGAEVEVKIKGKTYKAVIQ